jgi:CheY-like chemotaxis protein
MADGIANGAYLRVSVTDTGLGIKLPDQERIFQEFEQVDSSYARQQQGTGLGLALTRKLIEMHGGSIWVESEGIEGKGSQFTFLLPLQPAAAAKVRTDGGNDNKTVLLIEDDPALLGMLANVLQNKGFQVLQASGGRKGLELVTSYQPDMVVLDLMMPEFDGFQVIEELRSNPQTRNVPVLIHTGVDLSELEKRRLAGHAHSITYKAEPTTLLTEMERLGGSNRDDIQPGIQLSGINE